VYLSHGIGKGIKKLIIVHKKVKPLFSTTSIIFSSPKSKSKNVGGNNHQTHDQCLKWEYIDKICHI
jgi:hypothetical protein